MTKVVSRSDQQALAAHLSLAVGEWRFLADAEQAEYAIDGQQPFIVCFPASIDEVSAALALAERERVAVIPWGSGSKIGLGSIPKAADMVLCTRRLNRVLEHTPADLTVTVQAGIGLAELQHVLAAESQFLALDPPFGERATVGGILAANASGPRRLRYGTARDLLLGIKVVHADGQATKAGGKVVKNVAGYDLSKLYIGSLGTLGVILEASFRLHPLPERQATLWASFASPAPAMGTANQLLRSSLGPSALELLSPGACAQVGAGAIEPPGCVLLVGFEGFRRAVARQLSDGERLLREAGATGATAWEGAEERALWAKVREYPTLAAAGASAALCKVAVPVSRLAALFSQAAQEAQDYRLKGAMVAHAGSGVVYLSLPNTGECGLEGTASAIARLRSLAQGWGGSLVVECGPPELKESVGVWGEPGPAFHLMRALKDRFDPHGTLNPGRFVGGI